MDSQIILNDIKKLVIDTTLFDELNGYLSGNANFFEITGIVHREVKHSNFLAWLLDPSEKHGLSDWFFKKILENIDISQIESRNNTEIISILLDNYSEDLTLLTEWTLPGSTKRIDILAVSEKHKLVMCIENKVWSSEHDNQLINYENMINTKYGNDYTKIFVYLTPDGSDASLMTSWVCFGYCSILEILNKIDRLSLAPKIGFLIEDYEEILRRYIVQDDELDQIARKIYKKHKVAFDIIYEKVYANKGSTIAYADSALTSISDQAEIIYESSFSSSGIKRFRTEAMDQAFAKGREEDGSAWTATPSPYYYEVTNGNNKNWSVKLELSPYNYSKETLEVMEKVANKSAGYYQPEQRWRQAKSWKISELNDLELDNDDEYVVVIEKELKKIIGVIKLWEQKNIH